MYQEVIRDIRKRCRVAMNGVVSTSMREYGLNYKLNFGVSIQKIKEIATRYQPEKDLAEKLWAEDTRELKILATLLYPKEEYTEEVAKRWISEIPNQEIREQLGFNLFQYLPFTYKLGLECVESEDENVRATGYWFLARYLLSKGSDTNPDLAAFIYVWADLASENVSLRNAAKLMLKYIIRISKTLAHEILEKISIYKDSENLLEKEIYHGLAFEYQFYYEESEL